jgi:DNA-binding LacI/PurR family transcriptional regulator
MPTTIRDVARRAGVGLGTVSRVLNQSPLVHPETRSRVMQAVSDLDYVPNPSARGLSRGRTNTIAVIVPFFTRPSTIERLRGVELLLHAIDQPRANPVSEFLPTKLVELQSTCPPRAL